MSKTDQKINELFLENQKLIKRNKSLVFENEKLNEDNYNLDIELKKYRKAVDKVIEDSEEVGTSFEDIEFKSKSMGIQPEDKEFVNNIPLNKSAGKQAVKLVMLCPDNGTDVTAGIVRAIISEEDKAKGLKEQVLFEGFEPIDLNESIMLLGHRTDAPAVKIMDDIRNGPTYGVIHFDDYKVNAIEPLPILGNTLPLIIKTKSAQSETLVYRIYYKN